MSRAFVTDKEDWVYCPKAGERCMHAESGKECGKTDCEHFKKTVKLPAGATTAVRVVKRKPKAGAATGGAKTEAATKAGEAKAASKAQPQRKTKKSTLKKPKLWGGRPLD